MANSRIEWTDSTWNPVTGCTKVSPGCAHCYAERMAKRLQAMGQPSYANGFQVALQEHALNLPLAWKNPQMIFVNSMSDLFHENVPTDYIKKVFGVMRQADWHIFQVLTKRADRLEEISAKLSWPDNVWMGVSVANAAYRKRIDSLRVVPAAIRFLSIEPLIGPMGSIDLTGIDWVIVGGESGPGARPMEKSWVSEIQRQCSDSGVPFFFKQWGGVNKKKSGRMLDGKFFDEMPLAAREIVMAV